MKRSKSSQKKNSIPVILTIAGSDCSGGAGLQADLKTFTSIGVYGTSAVTCVVAEDPGRIARIDPLPAASVRAQIELTLEAFPVDAIKTGMLFSREIILTVADVLRKKAKGIPLVIDPVMIASAGGRLLKSDAIYALKTKLIPLAALVTPNVDEAIKLLDGDRTIVAAISDRRQTLTQSPYNRNIRLTPYYEIEWLQKMASMLYEEYGVPFLAKGGHFKTREAVDALCAAKSRCLYRAPRVSGISLHGTGCAYSAAIAAHLAKGLPLESAIAAGKKFISKAISQNNKIGKYGALKLTF